MKAPPTWKSLKQQKNVNVICLHTVLQKAFQWETQFKGVLAFHVELELEVLVLVERGKPDNPEKNPWNQDKINNKLNPHYGVNTRNQTQAILMGGECSCHCAIPASWGTPKDTFILVKPTAIDPTQ